MDRDPQSYADDVATIDDAIAALDPQHFWKMTEASGDLADSGFGNITLQDTGSPTYAAATGLTGITGVQFNSGSFFTPATALPASTTTFTILCVIKRLHDTLDIAGTILLSDSTLAGVYLHQTDFIPRMATAAGADLPDVSEFGTVELRQGTLLGVVVTAGTSRFYKNGLGYDGTGGSDPTIETFTPTRIGATAAGTNRLRAVLSRLVYMPGVALTDAQMATLWAARFSCHSGTLAIVKQALAHLGQSLAVTNLSTDATAAGVGFRLHYATAVESVLRAFAWPFANRYETLTLVGGTSSTAVNNDWQYSYRAPDRMVRALRVLTENEKRGYNPNPHPFRVEQDAVGSLIYTDVPNAILEFTIRPTCPALQGDVLFREALSWYLAALYVPTVAKDEATAEKCFRMFAIKVKQAEAVAANEEVPQNTNRNDPVWIANR